MVRFSAIFQSFVSRSSTIQHNTVMQYKFTLAPQSAAELKNNAQDAVKTETNAN